MVNMLMLLLSRRKMRARELAERYNISLRSVYRYVEELAVAGIPIYISRGRYGGIAIAVGIATYSGKVMQTVGQNICLMSPLAAWVVVVAQAVVLFLFASDNLQQLTQNYGLPAIPPVPVSSSQAVVGAVIGIGLLKGGHSVNWNLIRRIFIGWVATPVIAAAICYVSLFFLENVFNQTVHL